MRLHLVPIAIGRVVDEKLGTALVRSLGRLGHAGVDECRDALIDGQEVAGENQRVLFVDAYAIAPHVHRRRVRKVLELDNEVVEGIALGIP